jgi:hypothetical protein
MMKSRRMRWARHVAPLLERKILYRLLVVKPEGKRLLERLRRRRVNNIKLDLGEISWTGLGQWRAVVNTVMKIGVPSIVGAFLSSFATGDFSSRAQLQGVDQNIQHTGPIAPGLNKSEKES